MQATSEWISHYVRPVHREEGSPDSDNLLLNIKVNDGSIWYDQIVGYYSFETNKWYSQETDYPIEEGSMYCGPCEVTHYAYIKVPK